MSATLVGGAAAGAALDGVMLLGELHTGASNCWRARLYPAPTSSSDRPMRGVFDRVEVDGVGVGCFGEPCEQRRVARDVGGRRAAPDQQPLGEHGAFVFGESSAHRARDLRGPVHREIEGFAAAFGYRQAEHRAVADAELGVHQQTASVVLPSPIGPAIISDSSSAHSTSVPSPHRVGMVSGGRG